MTHSGPGADGHRAAWLQGGGTGNWKEAVEKTETCCHARVAVQGWNAARECV